MEITNIHNITKPIYDLICKQVQEPDEGAIRVTELISSPYKKAMKVKYWDELTIDANDLLAALIGTVTHKLLEEAQEDPNVIAEQFYEQPLTLVGDTIKECIDQNGVELTVNDMYTVVIKGTCDYFNIKTGELRDLKTTTVSKLAFLDGKPDQDWVNQLNIYAWLMRRLKWTVKSLGIWVILKDWKATQAERKRDYPQSQFVHYQIPLWTEKEQYDYVVKRVLYHMTPQHCTSEERWQSDDVWAVYGKSKARAKKLFTMESDAIAYEKDVKGESSIEFRKGESLHCKLYCEARSKCPTNPERITINDQKERR